ncbi:CAZyme family GT2 [Paecilomyces variotii]|nr:CAZyme family GT2 [Paecilomyces variotii]
MAFSEKGVNPSFLQRRSRRLFNVLDYNWIIFPLTFTALLYALYQLTVYTGLQQRIVDRNALWTVDCLILSIPFLPLVLTQRPPYAALWGLLLPARPFAYARSPKRRSFRSIRICLVTKGTNFQTVINSTASWHNLRHYPQLIFDVLVDAPETDRFRKALPHFINVYRVPDAKSFQANFARHKARALEWYRIQCQLTAEDWVLHLDEETELDDFAIQTCIDFIERGSEDIGMGTIFYNGRNHWQNTLMTVAEISRISEDWGRFQLPMRVSHRPLLGWMKGSWNIINGAVENNVTWDTNCAAEDFWFAFNATRLGYKFGWIHAIAREQPPETVNDFIRQRRRWYTGIWSIDSFSVKMGLLLALLVPLWVLIYPIVALVRGGSISVPYWFFVWLLFSHAADIHGLIVACLMEDMDTPGIGAISMLWHLLLSVVLSPITNLLQTGAMISVLIAPAPGFYIINKA